MKPVFQFYFRHDCHLCEDMWNQLIAERNHFEFELEPVDIDGDRMLLDKYGASIPVLAAGEKVLCHFYLDKTTLYEHIGVVTE